MHRSPTALSRFQSALLHTVVDRVHRILCLFDCVLLCLRLLGVCLSKAKTAHLGHGKAGDQQGNEKNNNEYESGASASVVHCLDARFFLFVQELRKTSMDLMRQVEDSVSVLIL